MERRRDEDTRAQKASEEVGERWKVRFFVEACRYSTTIFDMHENLHAKLICPTNRFSTCIIKANGVTTE